MTADPAGSGLNWYAYTGGDPVNGSDPSGLRIVTEYLNDGAVVCAYEIGEGGRAIVGCAGRGNNLPGRDYMELDVLSKAKVSAGMAYDILDYLAQAEARNLPAAGLSGIQFYSPCMTVFGVWDSTLNHHNTAAFGMLDDMFNDDATRFLRVTTGEVRGGPGDRIGAEITKEPYAGTNHNTSVITLNTSATTRWNNTPNESLGMHPNGTHNLWITDVYKVDDSMAQAILGATMILHELAHLMWTIPFFNPGYSFSLLGPGFAPDGGGGQSARNTTEIFDKCTTPWMFDNLARK